MTKPVLHGGKAEGLLHIRDLDNVKVPAFTSIPADASAKMRADIIRRFIKQSPPASKAAVRSSALGEDGAEMSYAGAFQTFLNVPMTEKDLTRAVKDVQGHGKRKLAKVFNRAAEKTMGVVVQHMVENPDFAGVCLSQGFGAEDAGYMLLNFREGLGDSLVGGTDNGRTLRVLRNTPFSDATLAQFPFLPRLMQSVDSIEKHFDGKPLDMEFATKNGEVYILQARPLVTQMPATAQMRTTAQKAVHALTPQVAAIAENDMLGDMTDINPRELLGQSPHPANVALFRVMFADDVVEDARAAMGYAPLHTGLLREVGGKPYVSVRAAAYSMRPQGISTAVYDKMVDIYLDILRTDPSLQDKVEFAVFITNTEQLPAFFAKYGDRLSANEQTEITMAFERTQTRLEQQTKVYCAGYAEMLQAYRRAFAGLTADSGEQEIVSVLQQGTRLFVQTARLAFYKKALCDTMFGEKAVQNMLVSLGTPSEQLQRDLFKYARGQIGEEDLVQRYGHLRAGQMDMFVPSYGADISKNLDLPRYRAMTEAEISAAEKAMSDKHASLERALTALSADQQEHVNNLRVLIAAREQVKHEFMRAYDLLATRQKARYAATPHAAVPPVLLPAVLTRKTDLACLEVGNAKGTYFGKGRIEALPVLVTDDNLQALKRGDVEGRILIMDHADPGYDFLLMFNPAAIITRIGGPASHIAIRVNEHGIPACIGCGIDPATVDLTKSYVLDCDAKTHQSGAAIKVAKRGAGYARYTP